MQAHLSPLLSEHNLICFCRMQHSGFSPEQQQMDFKEISTITAVLQSLCCFFLFRKPAADLMQGSSSFMVHFSSRMDGCPVSWTPQLYLQFSQPQGCCISLPASWEHPSHTQGWEQLLQWLQEQVGNKVLPCGAETWKTSSVVHYPPLTSTWNTFLRLWQSASSLSCQ